MHKNSKGKFTQYLNKARMRTKTHGHWEQTDLTQQSLQDLWDDQKGLCAWTGVPMELFDYKGIRNYWTAASLDRIDPSKGYVNGNVQFVFSPLNMAKKEYSDKDMKDFLTMLIESCSHE